MRDYIDVENDLGLPREYSHELIGGEGIVMVSAPHSVEQLRNGTLKRAEPQTAVLASLLHAELGVPIIYKTACLGDDANYDEYSPYREDLERYCRERGVRLLLDLHQLSQSRGMDIDIGTGLGSHIVNDSYLSTLIECLDRYRLSYTLDEPYSAIGQYTVSSHIYRTLSITTIQVEINSSLVWEPMDETSYDRVYYCLRDTIRQINRGID